jgi:energy-coupling factor transport system ATP-binding protein
MNDDRGDRLTIVAECLSARHSSTDILLNVDLAWPTEALVTSFLGSYDSGAAELAAILSGYFRRLLPMDIEGSARSRAGSLDHRRWSPTSATVGYVGPDPAHQIVGLSVDAELAWAEAIRRPQPVSHTPPPDDDFLLALGCERLRGRRVDTLSSGERQRVALASIAISTPDLLLLDSCFSALDSDVSSELAHYVDRRALAGLETWLVGMPKTKARDHGRRAAWLEGGNLVWHGESCEIPFANDDPFMIARLLMYTQIAESVADHCMSSSFAVTPGLTIGRVRLPSEVPRRLRLVVSGLKALGGELVGLQGPNGSGKSSLLSALIGLESSRRATVEVDWGHPNGSIPRICYLPPDGVTPWVAERPVPETWPGAIPDSVELASRLLGEDRYRRIEDGHYRERENPWRRLMWMIMGILADAPWLLLDEPTTGLDRFQRRFLVDILRSHASRGGGGLIISHDADFLSACCSRRVLLNDGLVVDQW